MIFGVQTARYAINWVITSMLWSIFLYMEHKIIYLFYFIPYNCNKIWNKINELCSPRSSCNFKSAAQPPSHLSSSALSQMYRSNHTAIIIKVTINIHTKLHCNEHFPHHHQRIISIFTLSSSSPTSPSPSHHQKRHPQENRHHHIHDKLRRRLYRYNHHNLYHITTIIYSFFPSFIP